MSQIAITRAWFRKDANRYQISVLWMQSGDRIIGSSGDQKINRASSHLMDPDRLAAVVGRDLTAMGINKEVQFIAHEHAERVILTDSFGKKHELKINLLTTADPDAAIAQEVMRMEQEETKVREIATKRGHRHPALGGLEQAIPGEGCEECGS
jgi:hypothetical protein